ncbi:FecR family protein [Chitinophaga sp. 22321]|uniref:FecR domain-containing protein n=1 Tax=Chitinophaga hostae TaxID=2831022 RepID=A0ABS5IZD2_9BACT|nr:FecR domain-containing protein [Chitinophaga hostae]MBS0028339.1 FecR domain-containing protein [Chitinophaga hostae]
MEYQHRDYTQYTATAFFEDEQFIHHVLKWDDEAIAYWQQLSALYPDKRNAMEEARAWILLLNKQPVYKPATDKLQLWEKIAGDIAVSNSREQRYYRPLKLVAKWTAAAAAVLLFIVMIRELSSHGEKSYSTTFGKHEQVVLPDESVVTLNGNSSIYYSRSWKSDKPREIWLNGEAYFEVKHVAIKNRWQQSDSFQVHVSDLALTVLGTKFNVRNRRNITEISLLEGRLRIEKNGPGAFVKILKPGDAFAYDSSKQLLQEMERKPQANKAWTANELDLDGYTLQEILDVLEDNYGYNITLEAPALAQKRLSGTVPANSAEDILFVIRKVFNLKINQKADHLIISQN